ncbi:restriction endonuclease subunit S [Alteriqipengyuania sp. 357]
MEDSEIPPGWHNVTLEDVAAFNPGVDKSQFMAEDELPFVPMPAVEAETGRIDVSERRPFSKVKNGFTSFETGDVLFAKITPCMENGKMAVVPPLPRNVGFGTTEFHVLRPTGAIDNRFLYYFVSSSAVRHEAQHHMTGAVGQKRVPKRFLETTQLWLPPLPEQQRIVEKIETLFAELDKGEEALREVQKLLARYRQSVLKAAVTGTLTAKGPTEWVPVVLGDLLADIRYGTAKKCRPDVAGTPVLRIPNVVGGDIDLADLKFTELTEKELEKLSLREGDMLIVRSNGSANLVGRGAIVTADAEGMAYAGYLIRLRLDRKRILPAFLHIVLNSPAVRARIERQAKSTSGVHNLNSAETKAIAFDLPDIDKQAEIVEAVEEAVTRIEKGEAWCETELKRSAALRQSILKDAFSGKLVPQDPSDEPAEKLLERIQAQREAAPKAKRKKAKA